MQSKAEKKKEKIDLPYTSAVCSAVPLKKKNPLVKVVSELAVHLFPILFFYSLTFFSATLFIT